MLFSPVYIEAHPCRPPHFVSGLTAIFYALLPNPFPCHTSEKLPPKSNHCHTSKIAVCNPCVCRTSDTLRWPSCQNRTRTDGCVPFPHCHYNFFAAGSIVPLLRHHGGGCFSPPLISHTVSRADSEPVEAASIR